MKNFSHKNRTLLILFVLLILDILKITNPRLNLLFADDIDSTIRPTPPPNTNTTGSGSGNGNASNAREQQLKKEITAIKLVIASIHESLKSDLAISDAAKLKEDTWEISQKDLVDIEEKSYWPSKTKKLLQTAKDEAIASENRLAELARRLNDESEKLSSDIKLGVESFFDRFVSAYQQVSSVEEDSSSNLEELADLRLEQQGFKTNPAGMSSEERQEYESRKTCFVPETYILTENGYVQLGDVEAGDKVFSCNKETGACSLNTIVAKRKLEKKQVKTFKTAAGSYRLTDDHPIFNASQQKFVEAKDFKIGDKIKSFDGEGVPFLGFADDSEETEVIEIQVAKDETFYVLQENYLADEKKPRGMLVHNCEILDLKLEEIERRNDAVLEAISTAVDPLGKLREVVERGVKDQELRGKLLAGIDALEVAELLLGTIRGGPVGGAVGSAKKVAAEEGGKKLGKNSVEKKVKKEAKKRSANGGNRNFEFKGPAAKKWDWDHIFDGHASWGNKAKHRGRHHQIFHGMSESQIKSHTQAAWKNRKNIGSQTDINGVTRTRYRGTNPENGRSVEFYYNQQTKTVETAFPVEG